jgi:hypothetical protein
LPFCFGLDLNVGRRLPENAELDIGAGITMHRGKEQHEEDPGARKEVQAGQGPVQERVAAARHLIF